MGSHDEFRVRVQTPEPRMVIDGLRGTSVSESQRALLGRVATTSEDDHVFLYADSEDVARAVAASVSRALSENGLTGQLSVWRWHPVEESWEDAAVPLPSTPEEVERERERLERLEDSESRTAGYDEWEVRVTLPSHAQAHELAQRLSGEGLSVERRWRYLIVGLEDEGGAQALARRLEREEPEADVVVEGAGMPLWEMLNPYSVFGGLGV